MPFEWIAPDTILNKQRTLINVIFRTNIYMNTPLFSLTRFISHYNSHLLLSILLWPCYSLRHFYSQAFHLCPSFSLYLTLFSPLRLFLLLSLFTWPVSLPPLALPLFSYFLSSLCPIRSSVFLSSSLFASMQITTVYDIRNCVSTQRNVNPHNDLRVSLVNFHLYLFTFGSVYLSLFPHFCCFFVFVSVWVFCHCFTPPHWYVVCFYNRHYCPSRTCTQLPHQIACSYLIFNFWLVTEFMLLLTMYTLHNRFLRWLLIIEIRKKT